MDTHRITRGPRIAAFISLPIAVLLLASCQTTDDSSEEASSWVDSLNESTATIPIEASITDSPLGTPSTQAYMGANTPSGKPKNFTSPVAASGASAAASTAARQAQRNQQSRWGVNRNPQPAVNQSDGRSVVVNVNQSVESGNSEAEEQAQQETQTSLLEQLYFGQFKRQANRKIQQFGYDIFVQPESDTSAIDDAPDDSPQNATGPIPGNYIIGPDDEVTLSLSGSVDAFYSLKVDRDGMLTVPDFGPISVAGIKYADLYDHILSFLNERRVNFDLVVSLGRLRTIQIQIIGSAEAPGMVEVSSLASPIEAIAAVGGASKEGSLRKVELQRMGESTRTIDLYDYLLAGSTKPEMLQLQDGDTLYIPPIGPTIGVAGYVLRPAIYELPGDELTVGDALALAGGLTPFSFTPLAHIERTVNGRDRQKSDVTLDKKGLSQKMSNGELLLIEAVDDTRQTLVRIEGEVARPGDYEYSAGLKIADLVKRADGLTINAYLPQVFISRQIGTSSHIDSIPGRTGHQQTRRVLVANLEKALGGDPQHNLELMPLDLITIRSFTNSQTKATVEIIGSVRRPGKYELTAGMSVKDLVAIAGNPTDDAFYDEAELVRRYFDESTRRLDAKRYRFDLSKALETETGKHGPDNPQLLNGDKLIIRQLQKAEIRVRIDGRVRFPGEYIFESGAQITDLMKAAGGLLDDADLRAAAFTRISTRQLQQQRLNNLKERTRRIYDGALEEMVRVGQPNEALAAKVAQVQTEDTINRLSSLQATGRIVLPFTREDFPESNYNLKLENGDRLDIPQAHQTISVAGHVFSPLSFVADSASTVESALDLAGGPTEFADEDLLYVVRADGSVESVAQKPPRLSKKTKLLAGDVLLVPRQPIERGLTSQAMDIIRVARQLAEVGLLSSQIGEDVDATVISPFDANRNVNASEILDNL
ncbi:MAG: SLBB domain-containing protein [Verrucomicrobiota bacterium]